MPQGRRNFSDALLLYSRPNLVDIDTISIAIPENKKFIPNKTPSVHRAVEGKPIMITNPSSNCKKAVSKLSHHMCTIPLVWNAKAAVAMLSNIK